MTVQPEPLPEADEADLIEQAQRAVGDAEQVEELPEPSTEANEADLIEQAQQVEADDDEDYLATGDQP